MTTTNNNNNNNKRPYTCLTPRPWAINQSPKKNKQKLNFSLSLSLSSLFSLHPLLKHVRLYRITKEVGKFISNIRSVGSETASSLTETLEGQLQLDEIRRAKDELESAFDFRRSINRDYQNQYDYKAGRRSGEGEGEDRILEEEEGKYVSMEGNEKGQGGSEGKKKVRRRMVRRKKTKEEEEVAGSTTKQAPTSTQTQTQTQTAVEDWESAIGNTNQDPVHQQEQQKVQKDDDEEEEEMSDDEWYADLMSKGEDNINDEYEDGGGGGGEDADGDVADDADDYEMDIAKSRFQSQLDSSSYNASVLSQSESNLSQSNAVVEIMKRLALLEEERKEALNLVREEAKKKGEINEKAFREKKELLQDGIRAIQQQQEQQQQ